MPHVRLLLVVLAGLFTSFAGCSDDTSNTDVHSGDDAGADADGEVETGADGDADGGDADAEADRADAEDTYDGFCSSNEQCQDDSYCNGLEQCEGTVCVSGDDPCNDLVECTVDTCDDDLVRCFHTGDNSLCQNEFACDGEEQCLATGCSAGSRPDCRDDSPCTIDRCEETATPAGCVHLERDLDGDTFMTRDYGCDAMGGTDCNDSDPLINPDSTEVCDDIRDNDCDGLADFADPTCRPANDTCAGATLLEHGVSVNASTRGTIHDYTIGCSYAYDAEDVAFAIEITETMDIVVDIETRGGTVYADFERTCGVSSSSMRCLSGSTVQLRRNSLPAGTYYVIVQGDGGVDFSITYTTEGPTPIPPNDVCTGAVDVPAAGGLVSGTLLDTSNHYVPSCAGGGAYPDVFYRLELTEPHKITITGQLTPAAYNTYVSLMTACGDVGTELACGSGSTATITRNFLDTGVYYIAVDGNAESPFSLNVRLEDPIYPPVNDRCPGTDISAGGTVIGTLADTYRDYPPSCSTTSLSDVVYSLTTTEPHDVTIAVSPVGASTTYVAALRTDCTDAATEIACRSGNPATFTRRSLPAGTYYIVVSGPATAPGNQFILQVTIGAPSPVPPNDLCVGAVEVSAGGRFVGSTASCSDDYDPTCGTALGYPDIVYNLTLAAPQDVTVALSSTAATSYVDVRNGTCGTGTTAIRCASGAAPSVFNRNVPAGSYWILVDTSIEATTTLDVTVGPPTTACDGARVITVDYTASSTFTYSDSGTTAGRPNDFTPTTCSTWSSAPDVPYQLVLPARSSVLVTADWTGFDGALHMRSACDVASSEVGCNDDCGTTARSCLPTLTLEAGTYYIIADGYSSGSGPFTLDVTATRL